MPCILVIFISSAWHSVDVYWIKNIFYSENLKYFFLLYVTLCLCFPNGIGFLLKIMQRLISNKQIV